MIIRADECMLEKCLEVIHESFATPAARFGLTKENCPTNGAFMPMERLRASYDAGNPMFAAIGTDGEMEGFVELSLRGDTCEMEKLAVVPGARRKGTGHALIIAARDEARAHGAQKMTIGIIEENEELKHWYMKEGFMHTGTRKFPFLPFTVGFMEMVI